MRIVWQKIALDHLENILDYIGQENVAAALGIHELIEKRVGQLADHPHLGREGRVTATRELIIAGTPFIVVYQLVPGQVQILAVLHGAMRWPDRF
ncbi:MAG: type II toxin-antitoxin system RelE/ParE family toxin [Gammaproteobacteria bacterium]|nr:type II toxin-antitoxin system RelE/ParE family toxin [Gammaproteobacteria bacterium]MBU1722474.1 type II toxin-antitoxin system RelE/ParE family toxin [Gammaproteobacteria bacterium]MBU2005507.1 type II toxin-antitoxin system RelE/ParE family toxin [Gammaproteobacteria bacterium]